MTVIGKVIEFISLPRSELLNKSLFFKDLIYISCTFGVHFTKFHLKNIVKTDTYCIYLSITNKCKNLWSVYGVFGKLDKYIN